MQFIPGTTYSFEIYGSNLVTTEFERCTVTGIVTARLARNTADIDALQALVRPSLPQNSPTDHNRYTYLIVELPTRQITAVAVEWIKQDTVRVVDGVGVVITTERNLSTDDVERIRLMLASAGISAKIEIVDGPPPA